MSKRGWKNMNRNVFTDHCPQHNWSVDIRRMANSTTKVNVVDGRILVLIFVCVYKRRGTWVRTHEK